MREILKLQFVKLTFFGQTSTGREVKKFNEIHNQARIKFQRSGSENRPHRLNLVNNSRTRTIQFEIQTIFRALCMPTCNKSM